jgi:hypothetical protein
MRTDKTKTIMMALAVTTMLAAPARAEFMVPEETGAESDNRITMPQLRAAMEADQEAQTTYFQEGMDAINAANAAAAQTAPSSMRDEAVAAAANAGTPPATTTEPGTAPEPGTAASVNPPQVSQPEPGTIESVRGGGGRDGRNPHVQQY